MKRYIISKPAINDLLGIREFIWQDNPVAANHVMKEFRQTFLKLARNPGVGRLSEDIASEAIRFWTLYSYVIIYHASNKPIEILRVVHGSRDVYSILQGIPRR